MSLIILTVSFLLTDCVKIKEDRASVQRSTNERRRITAKNAVILLLLKKRISSSESGSGFSGSADPYPSDSGDSDFDSAGSYCYGSAGPFRVTFSLSEIRGRGAGDTSTAPTERRSMKVCAKRALFIRFLPTIRISFREGS